MTGNAYDTAFVWIHRVLALRRGASEREPSPARHSTRQVICKNPYGAHVDLSVTLPLLDGRVRLVS